MPSLSNEILWMFLWRSTTFVAQLAAMIRLFASMNYLLAILMLYHVFIIVLVTNVQMRVNFYHATFPTFSSASPTLTSPLINFGSSASRRAARVRDSKILKRILSTSDAICIVNALATSMGGTVIS
jgi:hypothetical protein